MRLRKELKEHPFTTYIKGVEETVEHQWPDCLLKVSDSDGIPAAICLTSPGLPPETKSALLRSLKECPGLNIDPAQGSSSAIIRSDVHSGAKLALLNKDISRESEEDSSLFFDSERFAIDLGVVSGDAVQSRLPFAVLLIRADEGNVSADAGLPNTLVARIISQEFDADYSIYLYTYSSYSRESYCQSDVLAVVLPSTGLKRARQLAGKMRRRMEMEDNQVGASKKTLSIGVGVSSFGSKLSQDDFMVQIEDSLDAASRVGNSVRWNVGGYRETCQVTAEERRQLFSW